MKLNKRTVAREGLIIITIILLVGITLFISAKVKQNIEEEKANIYTASQIEAAKAHKYKTTKHDIEKKGINFELLDDLTKVSKEGELIYQVKLIEKEGQWNHITAVLNNITILLIAVYLTYLVISFVVWSIKILRIKS